MTTLGGIAQSPDVPLTHTLLAYWRKLLRARVILLVNKPPGYFDVDIAKVIIQALTVSFVNPEKEVSRTRDVSRMPGIVERVVGIAAPSHCDQPTERKLLSVVCWVLTVWHETGRLRCRITLRPYPQVRLVAVVPLTAGFHVDTLSLWDIH